MLYFLVSLLSVAVIGGASAVGGGGGGGDDSSIHGSYSLTANPNDAVAAGDTGADRYKTGEYSNQWGLNAIQAAEAYDYLETQGKSVAGDGVKIAITDTGVDLAHREIAPNDNGSLHVNGTGDFNGHGTHVASTAAGAKDNAFMHGVAYNSKIISLKTLDGAAISNSDGISYAAQNGAKVVNMSWGYVEDNPSTPDPDDTRSVFVEIDDNTYNNYKNLLSTSFTDAVSNDMVMVAAAGNDGSTESVSMPSLFAQDSSLKDAYSNSYMLAVTSVDQSNAISSFSNHCKQAKDYCISAPGSSIYAAVPYSLYYDTYQGTSMATPHVTGAVAVLRAAWPSLTATDTTQILLDSANSTGIWADSDVYGQGMLDLFAAVQAQGGQTLSSSASVGSAGYDVRNTSITSSNIFGNAYGKNLAPFLKNAVFFDKYGRDYKANLDQKITATTIGGAYNIDNITFNKNSFTSAPFSFSDDSQNLNLTFNARNIFTDPISGQKTSNKFGLKFLTVNNATEDPNDFANSDVVFAYSRKIGQNAQIGFSKNDFNNSFASANDLGKYSLLSKHNLAANSYQHLATNNFSADEGQEINSNQLNFSQKISPKLTTSLSYGFYNKSDAITKFSQDQSRLFESGIDYQLGKKTTLGFSVGNLTEMNNAFLGGTALGAFSAGEDPKTNYVNFKIARKLANNWQLITSYSEGKSNISGNDIGVFRSFDNIKSRGYSVALVNDDIFNGQFAAVYSEPLRVYGGSVHADIPVARDIDGNVHRMSTNISLVPDGKQKDLELSYGFNLHSQDARINFNSIITQEANNVKSANDQYLWLLQYGLKF